MRAKANRLAPAWRWPPLSPQRCDPNHSGARPIVLHNRQVNRRGGELRIARVGAVVEGAKLWEATMKWLVLSIIISLLPNFAQAHDNWSNGKKLPDWVKVSCCGSGDVHRLTMSNVHAAPWNQDYIIIDGYDEPIRKATALPSEDEFVWIFYKSGVNTPTGQSTTYCLFLPMGE